MLPSSPMTPECAPAGGSAVQLLHGIHQQQALVAGVKGAMPLRWSTSASALSPGRGIAASAQSSPYSTLRHPLPHESRAALLGASFAAEYAAASTHPHLHHPALCGPQVPQQWIHSGPAAPVTSQALAHSWSQQYAAATPSVRWMAPISPPSLPPPSFHASFPHPPHAIDVAEYIASLQRSDALPSIDGALRAAALQHPPAPTVFDPLSHVGHVRPLPWGHPRPSAAGPLSCEPPAALTASSTAASITIGSSVRPAIAAAGRVPNPVTAVRSAVPVEEVERRWLAEEAERRFAALYVDEHALDDDEADGLFLSQGTWAAEAWSVRGLHGRESANSSSEPWKDASAPSRGERLARRARLQPGSVARSRECATLR